MHKPASGYSYLCAEKPGYSGTVSILPQFNIGFQKHQEQKMLQNQTGID